MINLSRSIWDQHRMISSQIHRCFPQLSAFNPQHSLFQTSQSAYCPSRKFYSSPLSLLTNTSTIKSSSSSSFLFHSSPSFLHSSPFSILKSPSSRLYSPASSSSSSHPLLSSQTTFRVPHLLKRFPPSIVLPNFFSTQQTSTPKQPIPPPEEIIPWYRNDPFWFLKPHRWLIGRQPLTRDRFLAILAWFGLAGWLWALIATTTLVSFIVWLSGTLGFQKRLLERVGGYVAYQLGYQFSLESATVLGWHDGFVVIRDVKISSYPDALEKNEAIVDLTCRAAHVKLSLLSMLKGDGILQELHAEHVRGSIDRRHVVYDPSWVPTPRSWQKNSLDLRDCSLKDAEIVLRNPQPERDLLLSLFEVSLPRLRQQWLLFDIITAKRIHGAFDGSLLYFRRLDDPLQSGESSMDCTDYEIRLTGLKMDVLSANIPMYPFTWLTEGSMEVVIKANIPTWHKKESSYEFPLIADDRPNNIDMNIGLVLRNVKADMPLNPPDVPYVAQAAIRPFVVYLNTNYTRIPFEFPMAMLLSHFDGAIYPAEADIYNIMGTELFKKADILMQENTSFKSVGHWALFFLEGFGRGVRYLTLTALNI